MLRSASFQNKSGYTFTRRFSSKVKQEDTSMMYNALTNPGTWILSGVSFIGSYLYVGSISKGHKDDVIDYLMERQIVSFQESEDMMKLNNLPIGVFRSCLSDLDVTFPSGKCTADEFMTYVSNIIFKTNNKTTISQESNEITVHTLCHLERLLIWLEHEAAANTLGRTASLDSIDKEPVPVRKMMVALALTIKGSSEQRLEAIFEVYGGVSDEEDSDISREQFSYIMVDLMDTCHLPLRYQLTEIKSEMPILGISTWRRATSDELVDRALETREKEIKVKRDERILVGEFIAMLEAKPLCIWNDCLSEKLKRAQKSENI